MLAENKEYLEALGWMIQERELGKRKLFRRFTFKNYNEVFGFVSRLVLHAEASNHHPEITFDHKSVRIRLWTHDANDISISDIQFALWINNHLKV